MKLLVIVAHADDAEFRVGGLCTLYKNAGYDVRILAMCDGCCGHHELSRDEVRLKRAGEVKKVAELLNIRYDVFSDVDDGTITADLATRRRLIRYVREYSPDLIITHRTNDYHTDHRNTALAVQDASYMLAVPNECSDVPAMLKMPVIMAHDDEFTNPPFRADVVIGIDSVINDKYRLLDCHVSQVYEWLPYVNGDPRPVPPEGDGDARMAFLIGDEVTADTSDATVKNMSKFGLARRFALPAAKFRKQLIKRYGKKDGKKIRFAEAFEVSEYGAPLTAEIAEKLFPF